MDVYRSKHPTPYIKGTINLRSIMRRHMSREQVNRALVQLAREPYEVHAFATRTYGLDLLVEITPASGIFTVTEARW